MPSMLSFKVLGMIGLASYSMAYICARRRHIAYHRYQLIALPASALPAMPRGYAFRELTACELAPFEIDIGHQAQAERFARGLRCIATFDRTQALVGVTWLGRMVHDERDLHIRYLLPDNAAWDTGLWIPENRRMGRAFSAVWGATRLWLEREGLEWTLSSIADYNVSSILAHRRLGSVRLHHVVVLRIGRFQVNLGAWPLFCLIGRTKKPAVRLARAMPRALRVNASATSEPSLEKPEPVAR